MGTEAGLQETFELMSTAILLDSSKSVYMRLSSAANSNHLHISIFIRLGKVGAASDAEEVSELRRRLKKIQLLPGQLKSWALNFIRSKSAQIWSMGFLHGERVPVSRWSEGLSAFAAAVLIFNYTRSSFVVTLYGRCFSLVVCSLT